MAGPDTRGGQLAQRGHIFKGAVEHAIQNRLIHAILFGVELARRADQDLAGFSRLDIECHGIFADAVSAFEVAKLDDLMMHKPGVAVGDDEVSLSFADGEAGGESRRPWPGGVDGTIRGNIRSFGQRDPSFGQQFAHGNSRAYFRAMMLRFIEQESSGAGGIDYRVVRHAQASRHSRPQIRLSRLHGSFVEHFDTHPMLAISKLLAMDLLHFFVIGGQPKCAALIVLDLRRQIASQLMP
jgi:hypothetical protein